MTKLVHMHKEVSARDQLLLRGPAPSQRGDTARMREIEKVKLHGGEASAQLWRHEATATCKVSSSISVVCMSRTNHTRTRLSAMPREAKNLPSAQQCVASGGDARANTACTWRELERVCGTGGRLAPHCRVFMRQRGGSSLWGLNNSCDAHQRCLVLKFTYMSLPQLDEGAAGKQLV